MGSNQSRKTLVDAAVQTEFNVVVMLKPLQEKFLESIREGSITGWSVETYTKESVKTVMTYAQHSAIVVYNHCFEFDEDNGISHISDLKVVRDETVPKYPEKWEFTTGRSLQEFLGWVFGEENCSKFSKDNYRVGTLNCHHFIQQCCSFLEVNLPMEIWEILDFCRKNSGGLNMLRLLRPLARSFHSEKRPAPVAPKYGINTKQRKNPSKTDHKKVSRGTSTSWK